MLSDQELIRLLKDPERQNEGFNRLIAKYRQRIYWQIRRMVISHDDADDIAQNVFLKIFQHVQQFREDSGLFTWIYRITVNESLAHLKSLKKRTLFFSGDYTEKLSGYLTHDNHFNGNQIQLKLQKAILKLPEKQRLVFNMKYFDESLTFEEMSKILDTSVGALKASYHHAVKKIEKSVLED